MLGTNTCTFTHKTRCDTIREHILIYHCVVETHGLWNYGIRNGKYYLARLRSTNTHYIIFSLNPFIHLKHYVQ